MSFKDDILLYLCERRDADSPTTYKKLWNQMAGRMEVPEMEERHRKKELREATLRVTLCRLRRQGLVGRRNMMWYVTAKGRNIVKVLKMEKTEKMFPPHSDPSAPGKPKSVIIAFDIPEHWRWKRDWLRDELTILTFKPIQKSVWFGPKPPKEFIEHLHQLYLLPHVKFFKAKSAEIV